MFRFLTAGESHGPALTTIIEGVPAGLGITADPINLQLKRRQGGYGRGARQKIESDTVEFLSGVRFGRALGSPVTMVVRNRDWANWTTKMSIEPLPEDQQETPAITVPRPGH
ncbi:MAG: chorismate synthase, partial [Capsulimonas sp.]|uniref:chorismate synthase n=1 Tax=Capsulimonas sp. TaxID=2494211 RepID=UPI0032638A21